MQELDKSSSSDSWVDVLGSGEGRTAWRSAPLGSGKPAYWYAAARICKNGDRISDAVLALKGPDGVARRLGAIESRLLDGKLPDADAVLDAVRDLVECEDDADGSAAVKSYLAGWICADVVGRCLTGAENA